MRRAATAAARAYVCCRTTRPRAPASRSAVRDVKGTGSVAAPIAASRAAQNGWSAVTGTGIEGARHAVRRRCARPGMVDHRGHPREQQRVRYVADGQDVVAGGGESGAARLEDAAQPGAAQRLDGELAEPLAVAGRHAAEADEHRAGAGREEVLHLGRQPTVRCDVRPPGADDVESGTPVGRAWHQRRAEAVQDGPVRAILSAAHLARPQGRQVEAAAKPGHGFGVDAVGHAQREASGDAVAEAAELAGSHDVGWEVAGRGGGLEVGGDRRDAHGLGHVLAERCRGGGQEEQVRVRVHGVGEAVSEFGDERGGRPHQFASALDSALGLRAAGQAPEPQACLPYQRCERVGRGERDVVARLAQACPQPGVRRDVAA